MRGIQSHLNGEMLEHCRKSGWILGTRRALYLGKCSTGHNTNSHLRRQNKIMKNQLIFCWILKIKF